MYLLLSCPETMLADVNSKHYLYQWFQKASLLLFKDVSSCKAVASPKACITKRTVYLHPNWSESGCKRLHVLLHSVCSNHSGGIQCMPIFLYGHKGEKTDQKVEWESKDLQLWLSLAGALCCLVNSIKETFYHWKAQFLLSALETVPLGRGRGVFVKEI